MGKTYIYSYRLTYFGGTAPCYDNGILTLAICKRDMRRVIAKRKLIEKDSDIWFVGIVGNKLSSYTGFGEKENQVLYIAKVTDVVPFSDYFDGEKDRKDKIYRITEEKTKLESGNDCFKHIGNEVHKEIELQLRDFDVAHKIPIKYVLVSKHYSFISEKQSNKIIEIVQDNEYKWAKGVGHCWFEDYDGVLAKEFENIVSSNKEHNISVLPSPYCYKDNKNCGGCGSKKEDTV